MQISVILRDEFEVVHELLCVILSIYEEDWRHP